MNRVCATHWSLKDDVFRLIHSPAFVQTNAMDNWVDCHGSLNSRRLLHLQFMEPLVSLCQGYSPQLSASKLLTETETSFDLETTEFTMLPKYRPTLARPSHLQSIGLFGGTLPARHSVSRCALMPVFPETSWIFQLFLVLLTMRRWR